MFTEKSRTVWKELGALYVSFLKIGAFLFGGGYSMLPLLNRELVDRRGWTTEAEMLDYFAIAQCTPGVIAVNTATFVGYYQLGIPGSAVATLGVVTVPTILILIIAALLQGIWANPLVTHAFGGIRCAVAALIAAAVLRLFRAQVQGVWGIVLCLLGFVAIAILGVSPIWVVALAAACGIVAWRIQK